MSPSENRNGREADTIPEGGILAALPRARPQRASARRAAARTNAATKTSPRAKTSAKVKTSVKAKPSAATKTKRVTKRGPAQAQAKAASKKRGAKQAEPPVPKQGYEPEEELEMGKTVHPPSGLELVESVADILGELAGSSLGAGGRLLKDAFSLLRRP